MKFADAQMAASTLKVGSRAAFSLLLNAALLRSFM
jgi:hypothetical protein